MNRPPDRHSLDDIDAFLRRFHRGGHWPLYAIKPRAGAMPRKIAYYDFLPGETQVASAQRWCADHNSADHGVYFKIFHPTHPVGNQHAKAMVLEANCLFADCDPPAGLSGPGVDTWRADKIQELRVGEEGVPSPSLIVDSGNGIWAFWFFAEPHPVDGRGPLTAIVEGALKALARLYGGDTKACEISHGARLPGFVNHKTGRVARVVEYRPDAVFDAETLIEKLEQVSPAPQFIKGPAGADLGVDDDDAAQEAVRQLLAVADPAIQGAGGRGVSMALVQRCGDLGCTFETACRLMESSVWNSRCRPPWEPGELAKEFDSLVRDDPVGSGRKPRKHTLFEIKTAIDAADRGQAAQVFCDMAASGDLDPVEEAALVKLVAKRQGVGAPAVAAKLKMTREKKHEERAVRAAVPVGELVTIDGVEKRVTDMAGLNKKYAILETDGSASVYVSRVDFLPIQDTDLRRRLSGSVVQIGSKNGNPIYQPAYNFWSGHASRHVYRRVAFTSKTVSADTYNLFRGLGVKPTEGLCERIIAHIREVICSGNLVDFEAMLKLMAWQLQNIGVPCRVIVILKSEKQQVGKGMMLEMMVEIYGPSGFSAATTEQVLGRFNDPIRGRSLVVLDEVIFAGDRRSADAIKRLSTASSYSVETKGLPIITCPAAVNFWMASNHDSAAFIESSDARHWALDVSARRKGDATYFTALKKEMDDGGREAFAHYLLNMDVSGFVPARDCPMDNPLKRAMIRLSINPWDARKWLEACCETQTLRGMEDTNGNATLWRAGDEYPFGYLVDAYEDWQKSVRSGIRAMPTQTAALGGVLTTAGFGLRHAKGGNVRILPEIEECLECLHNPNKPKGTLDV